MTKKSLFGLYGRGGADIFPSFHMEADGRGKRISVVFSGVIGVRELSEKQILIISKSEAFAVTGELLSVSVLESNRIKVVGVIDSIAFSKRKRGGAG